MLKQILKILESDARISARQMSAMTGLGQAEVTRRVKQAEDSRAILGYKTIINWQKVGEKQVWALIEVKVKPEPEAGFDAIAGRISQFPQVHDAYLTSGSNDLLVVVVDKAESDIADFVSQKLSHIEGVQSTETHFVLRRYKENGIMCEDDEVVKRQPVIL
ncbi:Lrp/AsnC family transcriptional regulator [Chloroflexota bacterium]